MIDNVL